MINPIDGTDETEFVQVRVDADRISPDLLDWIIAFLASILLVELVLLW